MSLVNPNPLYRIGNWFISKYSSTSHHLTAMDAESFYQEDDDETHYLIMPMQQTASPHKDIFLFDCSKSPYNCLHVTTPRALQQPSKSICRNFTAVCRPTVTKNNLEI